MSQDQVRQIAEIVKELKELGKLGVKGCKKAIQYVQSNPSEFSDINMGVREGADLALQLGSMS